MLRFSNYHSLKKPTSRKQYFYNKTFSIRIYVFIFYPDSAVTKRAANRRKRESVTIFKWLYTFDLFIAKRASCFYRNEFTIQKLHQNPLQTTRRFDLVLKFHTFLFFRFLQQKISTAGRYEMTAPSVPH